MSRKTFSVLEFQNKINENLAANKLSLMEKRLLCNQLEGILHQTDNYCGFSFLSDVHSENFEAETALSYDKESDTFHYGPRYFDRFYFINPSLR